MLSSTARGALLLHRGPIINAHRLLRTSAPAASKGDDNLENDGDGTLGKINFGRLVLHNKRHLQRHKEEMGMSGPRRRNKYPDIRIHDYGTRRGGFQQPSGFQPVKEMRPELVVPDLEGFNLKPYVSYRTREIHQEELSSKDLFNAVYGKKVLKDFQEGRLDDEGNATEPSEEERMTAEEARVKARQTGSDVFVGGNPRSKYWNVRWEYRDT